MGDATENEKRVALELRPPQSRLSWLAAGCLVFVGFSIALIASAVMHESAAPPPGTCPSVVEEVHSQADIIVFEGGMDEGEMLDTVPDSELLAKREGAKVHRQHSAVSFEPASPRRRSLLQKAHIAAFGWNSYKNEPTLEAQLRGYQVPPFPRREGKADLQRLFGLPVTGEEDNATMAHMARERCDFPDGRLLFRPLRPVSGRRLRYL